MDLRIPQGKPGEDGDDGDDGISPTLRLTEQGIEVSYDKGNTWNLLIPISEFHVTNNITNEYINNPDEEDITVVDDKLKFKDKEYNVTTVAAGGNATADVRADGADPSGNPIYKVDFGIPRGSNGIDGDDGVSAGFGEPTASAEAVASDVAPSVVVTATGTNTSKVFNFAFKIPKGINGTDGDNGLTPTIGENGNWMIGAVDTGVKAKGEDGLTGKTPVFETGEVVTGAAGTAAIVTVVLNGVDEGGNPKYLINFTIPRGADGTGGGGGTDRGRCVFTLEDYSAAYRPEIGLSKILPAISGFALNDCVIDVTGSVRQVTAVSEDKQTANLSDVIYTFPTGGGTGGVTEARVTEMINAVVGDINTILDNINGEVI